MAAAELPTWSPGTPPPRLLRKPVSTRSPRWKAWLTGQGYSPGELPGILGGADGAPGLASAVEDRVAELEGAAGGRGQDLDPGQVAEARAGAVRVYLSAHPPIKVGGLDHRPPAFLAPAELGQRLTPLAAGPGGRQVLGDLMTGERWWTTGKAGGQARAAVSAGVLYRLVGVAAPAARLANLPGGETAVHPEPREWYTLDRALWPTWKETVAAQLPADAWLGWRAGRKGIRGRSIAGGQGPGVLRLDIGATLGWTPGGQRVSQWGLSVPSVSGGLQVIAETDVDRQVLAPMAQTLAGVTDRQIGEGLIAAGLDRQAAAVLRAVLIGRRDLVVAQVEDLISGAGGPV